MERATTLRDSPHWGALVWGVRAMFVCLAVVGVGLGVRIAAPGADPQVLVVGLVAYVLSMAFTLVTISRLRASLEPAPAIIDIHRAAVHDAFRGRRSPVNT